jgi:trehalose 6-phosphate synthase
LQRCPFDSDLLLVSNRGPFSYHRDDSGQLITNRGSGGLVTSLLGVAAVCDVTWIASAMTHEDIEVSRSADGGRIEVASDEVKLGLRFVVSDHDSYHKFYNVIANPLIWFIQHYLWDLAVAPEIGKEELDAWEEGYQAVNRQFADTVCEELEAAEGQKPAVMLNDYHLYTCPSMIRERHPDVFLHQFVHIPWTQPDAWLVLPRPIREAVVSGLLANDIVAFHTKKYARNFLLTCEQLLGCEVDLDNARVLLDGREVWVRAYPISVDCEEFERLAGLEPVLAQEEEIIARRRDHLVLRVDRMDLSKNIVRGFKAYGRFLEQHPEFHEKVTFLALLQPSREEVPQYASYREQIMKIVAEVNARHGTTDWTPIDVLLEDSFYRSVAAYKQYDALMVNAVFDGMNLIAKEAGLINSRDGVLILSENTGAHEQLGEFALSVNPFDIEDQAQAIHQALTMSEVEKSRRTGKIKETVKDYDIHKWIETQFIDIKKKMNS